MTTVVVDLGDPDNPPVIDLGGPGVPPTLDLDWQPTEVLIPIGVGVPGPAGRDGGGALRFDVTAVSSRSFTHSFAYPPNVHLAKDGALALVSAEYPDSTHVYLEFPTPFTGTVVLS